MPDGHPKRRKLNWFSPLRPAHTDVAHYAVRALPSLSDHFDITVWTEHPYWPPELDTCARVRQWQGEPWNELNAADATLYHIGNNARFHGWIWNVAQRHPGIVVLHDTRLHEFFTAQLLESDGGASAYLNAIRRCYGDAAALAAAGLIDGQTTPASLAASLPMTELVLGRARGAIVHSGPAFEQVAALARCPVAQLDLPYDAGDAAAPRSWDGVLRLVVFGYLAANRRIESLLSAIAGCPARDRVRLDIFGEMDEPEVMTGRIEELGLSDIVHVHGFVPEAQLDDALDRSSLAINLRYPTMGEASGSQLRIWSRGLASLVTRTGWYQDLPADAVAFVDPDNEIADLQRHFQMAVDNPDALLRMGEAGRRHLEARHSPERYASDMADAVGLMMKTPASIVEEMTEVVSRAMAECALGGPPQLALAQRTAVELCRWIGGRDIPEFTVGDT